MTTAPDTDVTPVVDARAVRWGGLPNARDLGGLPTAGGGRTRPGRFYRTARLDHAGADGLAAMAAAGVRTVVDLRNAAEAGPLALPPVVTRHALPVEDPDDEEFMRVWGPHLDTPRYYPTVLATWPRLVAAVFGAFARAPDGAVVYHCAAGRDRTGMITALLLTLVEVPRPVIVEDYLLAVRATNARAAGPGENHERYRGPAELADWCADVGGALEDFLDGVDVAAFLRRHGVTGEELDRVRRRLLD